MQLPLPIDWRSSGQDSGVVLGEGNAHALDLLSRPHLWPSHCMLLVGPPRSGRSTIAAEIARQGIADSIDDADRADEAALFHRWNVAREAGQRLIFVAADVPPHWVIALPDLRSRLSSAGVARIDAPDEAMIEAMIVQGLGRAGTAFAADAPRYMAQRLPRCYQQIEAALAVLTSESLSSGRKISLPRAKLALEGSGLLSADD